MSLSGLSKDHLLFAVPKKGRLNAATLELLAGSDLQFHRQNRSDVALVKNLSVALVFLPAADIPTFVSEGHVDLGITGRDQVAEYEAENAATATTGAQEVLNLGFGGCRLQVQVPVDGSFQTAEQLIGRNIVTSFPGLTAKYFRGLENAQSQGGAAATTEQTPLKTHIRCVGGSVETACALGVGDGVVDLVESGETMRAAGLKAIDTVIDSIAVLIRSKNPTNPDLVTLITKRIEGVLAAQRYVLCTYNIERKHLAQARQITPGKRAPTVNSLEEEGWVAVSAMVERAKIAPIMDSLTEIGAMDILVTKIENTRTS